MLKYKYQLININYYDKYTDLLFFGKCLNVRGLIILNNSMIEFEKLEEKDIDELTPIMKRAFDEDAKIHLGQEEGGPEGYDNGDFIRKWGLNKQATSYKILLNNKSAGLVILWINDTSNENMLGAIFIDTCYQNIGIGQKVWQLVEERFPNTKVWRTETPGFSRRNHYFYVMKCGFKIVRIENPMDKYESNYVMEKRL
jgi:ribosomal protein S18 acetylase RimI-like enzyme